MARRIAHWSWLAVAAACLGLFSSPADAYDTGTLLYSDGDAVSYTYLDSGDLYAGVEDCYVDLKLTFDGSSPWEDYGFCNWVYHATAYIYENEGPGYYYAEGDHWIYWYDFGWEELDPKTSDYIDDGSFPPTCEVSSYVGPYSAGGSYGASFTADLGYAEDPGCYTPFDGTFYSGTVEEDVEGIGSGCLDPVTLGPFVPDIADNSSWVVCSDSSYGGCDSRPDTMSYDTDTVDALQYSIGTIFAQDACWLWYGSQAMYYYGTGGYYQTNDIGIYLDGSNGMGYRGNASGSIY